MGPNVFSNTHVLITGASRGIGKAIALRLAKEGCSLALVARNEKDLQKTCEDCVQAGGRAVAFPYDLEHVEGLESLVQTVVQRLGGLNVLINNAAIAHHHRFHDATLKEWDHLFTVNLQSLFHLTYHAVKEIKKNKDGAVINIASTAAKISYSGGTAYCASKHGVLGFANALFEEIRETGTKVSSICPGFVNTDMVGKRSGMDLQKMIQPEDIAETVLFVLRMPSTSCPTELMIRPQRSPVRA